MVVEISAAFATSGIGGQGEEGGKREDVDVLEIPVFVRVEWESSSAEVERGGGSGSGNERRDGEDKDGEKDKDKDRKEKRELAFWCVIGVGTGIVDGSLRLSRVV